MLLIFNRARNSLSILITATRLSGFRKLFNMKDSIIQLAIEVASYSILRQRVGAVIFRGSRVIATGYNETSFCGKIHPKYKHFPESIHAEQAAILNSPRRLLKGSSVLVVRYQRDDHGFSNAKPCQMCMAFLNFVNIKKIFYTTSSGEIVKLT